MMLTTRQRRKVQGLNVLATRATWVRIGTLAANARGFPRRHQTLAFFGLRIFPDAAA